MASRLVPILLGTGVLALILLSRESKAATPTKQPEKKTGGGGGGGIVRRPLNKTNLPAGTQIAIVTPACDAQDRIAFPGCDNGILLHSSPDGTAATRVAPPGVQHPEHPRAGEEIGILPGRDSIPELNMPGSALNRWAEIIGAGGFRGFVRVTDSKGRRNIQPTGEVVGGGAPPEEEQPITMGAWPGYGRGYGPGYAWRHRLPPAMRHHLLHRGGGMHAGLDHAALQQLAAAQRARVSAVGPFFTEEDRAKMVRRMLRESRRAA